VVARLVDSHAHLDRREYASDLDDVVARARAAGVERIVVVGLWRGAGDFGDALDLVDRDPATFVAAIGIHPHECSQVPEADWAESERLAHDPRVVAVGETGLDFHYDYSPRDVQVESFRRSIRIAKGAGKPVVVHVREADDACADVLEAEGVPEAAGVIHCFTGDWTRARRYLDLGLYLSVAGVLTFKAADDLRDAIRQVPRNRLLVETDCPFLAPVPFRGKRNEPAYVAKTAAAVAALWGVTPEQVAEFTTANVERLFRLPPLRRE
jgi:TatD DNase family protein